eukprot:102548_1
MIIVSTSLLFILTVLQTTVQSEDCGCSPICDMVVDELADAESDRSGKFAFLSTRFNSLDVSLDSLESYLKNEIDAQSEMMNTRFTESNTNINNEFKSSTDNINVKFSTSTHNINNQFGLSTK